MYISFESDHTAHFPGCGCRNMTQTEMFGKCQEIDRMGAAYLAAHPESPRYCYTCQQWLTHATEVSAHPGHSIH
jgi:hypothetical protein